MSRYFQILLIILIAVYLVFESIYNFDMLNAASSVASSSLKTTLEELEVRGHRVSSIGLTLFLVPFFYTFAKKIFQKQSKWREKVIFCLVCILSLISYKSIYISLEKLMDYIVSKNHDKRYEAYYINSLKYNIIGGSFGFESFLDRKTVGDISNSVYAKTLISNIFLLTFLDENLSDKVKKNSENIADELYLNSEDIRQKRDEERKLFIQKANEIKNGYTEYNNVRNQLNQGFEKAGVNNGEKEYQKFTQNINKKYDEYVKNSDIFFNEQQKQLLKVEDYYDDLIRYFRNRELGENRYKQSMKKNFGRYIEPVNWCYNNACPHRTAIKQMIEKESISKWNKKSKVPPGLTQIEFLKHKSVKSSVISELRKKGLNVKDNFNYSKAQFLESYNNAFNNKYNVKANEFRVEFEKKTGIKNVAMNLDWNGFVELFRPQFLEKFDNSKQETENALSLVFYGNLENFDDFVFNPLALKKFDKMQYLFVKDDFYQNQKAINYGDKALKSLYIPPFAISVSIISGVLNLINLLSMIVFLFCFKNSNFAKNITKFSIIVLTAISIAVFSPNYLKDNVAINKLKEQNGLLNGYLNLLNSVIWLEEINYNLNAKI